PSEQAANRVADVIAMKRRHLRSARTTTPFSGSPNTTNPSARLLTARPLPQQTPPSRTDGRCPASPPTRAALTQARVLDRPVHRLRRKTAPSTPPSPSRLPARASPRRVGLRRATTPA